MNPLTPTRMARNRMIKPEFWGHKLLSSVSRDSRLLYIGMWSFSDDYGVIKAKPSWIQENVFEEDDDVDLKMMKKWLAELEKIKRIIRFTVDGKDYYFMPKFLEHQRIDKPSKTRNPEPTHEVLARHSGGSRDEVEVEVEKEIEVKVESRVEPSALTPAQGMRSFMRSVLEKNDEYQSLLEKLAEGGIEKNVSSRELDKFVNYWSERNRSGTKERWELEKTFEVQRRLAKWFENAGKFSGGGIKKFKVGIV